MDETRTKLVPLGGYPAELRQRAIELYKQGYTKTNVAEALGIGRSTARRWLKQGEHPYLKPHPLEVKQKAIELVKSGTSRKEVADQLKISYFTIVFWCRGINTWRKHRIYPMKLKKKARKLVRSGVKKTEVAGMLSVPYYIISSWTADIHSANSKLSGAAEKILAEVVEKGYFFPKPAQLNVCRSLKQNVGLRLTRLNGKWILYSHSEKEKAMKAMLEKSKMNYLSRQRLFNLKLLFYEPNIQGKSD